MEEDEKLDAAFIHAVLNDVNRARTLEALLALAKDINSSWVLTRHLLSTAANRSIVLELVQSQQLMKKYAKAAAHTFLLLGPARQALLSAPVDLVQIAEKLCGMVTHMVLAFLSKPPQVQAVWSQLAASGEPDAAVHTGVISQVKSHAEHQLHSALQTAHPICPLAALFDEALQQQQQQHSSSTQGQQQQQSSKQTPDQEQKRKAKGLKGGFFAPKSAASKPAAAAAGGAGPSASAKAAANTQQQDDLQRLAAWSIPIMRLWTSISVILPDHKVFQQPYLCTVAPAMKLAAAVLNNWPGPEAAAAAQASAEERYAAQQGVAQSGFCSSYGGVNSSSIALCCAATLALDVAHVMVTAVYIELPALEKNQDVMYITYDGVVKDHSVVELLYSDVLQRLLLIHFCWCVQVVHSAQHGKSLVSIPAPPCSSSSAGQQQRQQRQIMVEAYHEKGLAALGMAGLNAGPCSFTSTQKMGSNVTPAGLAETSLIALLRISAHREHPIYAELGFLDNGGQRTDWPNATHKHSAVAKPDVLPMLLTVLQLVVLAPRTDTAVYGMEMIDLLMDCLIRWHFRPDSPAHMESYCIVQAYRMAVPVALRPMLHWLAPALLHCLREYEVEQQANRGLTRKDAREELLKIVHTFGTLMLRMTNTVGDSLTIIHSELLEHYSSNPAVVTTALDACIRTLFKYLATGGVRPSAAPVTLAFAHRVVVAVNGVPTEHKAAVAAATQPYLCSLLLSCLKAGTRAAAAENSSCWYPVTQQMDSWTALKQAAYVARCAARYAAAVAGIPEAIDAADSCSSVSSEQLSHDAAQVVVPLLAVIARSVWVLGRLLLSPTSAQLEQLEQHAAAVTVRYLKTVLPGGSADELQRSVSQLLSAVRTLHMLLGRIVLPADVSTATAAANASALPRLLDQAGQLTSKVSTVLKQLGSLQTAGASSMAAASNLGTILRTARQVVGSDLAQQLQQLGAEVSAQLPVQCCNNPSCVALNGMSEMQLVSGRNCTCSGCGLVRYCSRQCQLAAWKQHKPVCKRFKAARNRKDADA